MRCGLRSEYKQTGLGLRARVSEFGSVLLEDEDLGFQLGVEVGFLLDELDLVEALDLGEDGVRCGVWSDGWISHGRGTCPRRYRDSCSSGVLVYTSLRGGTQKRKTRARKKKRKLVVSLGWSGRIWGRKNSH